MNYSASEADIQKIIRQVEASIATMISTKIGYPLAAISKAAAEQLHWPRDHKSDIDAFLIAAWVRVYPAYAAPR
jgi:hypothetical protein